MPEHVGDGLGLTGRSMPSPGQGRWRLAPQGLAHPGNALLPVSSLLRSTAGQSRPSWCGESLENVLKTAQNRRFHRSNLCAILGLNPVDAFAAIDAVVAASVYDDRGRSQQGNAMGSASNRPHS